jgi:polyhydroxybutyrate depolymerase
MSHRILLAGMLFVGSACFRGSKDNPQEDGGGARASDGGLASSESKNVTLNVDGRERKFIAYLPGGRIEGAKIPLLFVLHGGQGSPEEMVGLADFRGVADREKVVLIYPAGVEKSWNDGRPTDANKMGVDDVNFFRKMSEFAVQNLSVDAKRIFATGISNGGFMSARLGCELSDTIAGIASVAASMSQVVFDSCRPPKPVAALVMQGDADPFVPYSGGMVSPGAGGFAVSHEQVLQKWVSVNQSAASPTVINLPDLARDGTTVVESVFAGGTSGVDVVGYTIVNGGHTWPQGPQYLSERIIGKTSQDINANEVIWAFFKRQVR